MRHMLAGLDPKIRRDEETKWRTNMLAGVGCMWVNNCLTNKSCLQSDVSNMLINSLD